MIRKSYVDTRLGQLHVRECAGGNEPIILLHQNASTGQAYERVMHALDGVRRLIAPDTPGFGASFAFDGSAFIGRPSMATYAQVVIDLLDRLGIERAHLVGHHAGSVLALRCAVDHASRVAGVVLSAPACLTPQERAEFGASFGKRIEPRADGSHLLDCWRYVGQLGAGADVMLHTREAIDTAHAVDGRTANYDALWEEDYPALLSRLSVPVGLMCSPDDALWPYFERARAIRPNAPYTTVGGGNYSSDLDSQGFAAAVRKFVCGNYT
jgi:pimeloyl-ACP methyl ester carboxylesterase